MGIAATIVKTAAHMELTAPFNNMQTLKFKIQPTVTLFTAVNHLENWLNNWSKGLVRRL